MRTPLLLLSAITMLAATPKPNFIIIFADDQGYQDLGCYGSPDIKTPNIDRMAKEGMRFTAFYAQTVCGPSRAALMTGCYPLRNARNDNGSVPHPKLASSEITIAEILKTQGYSTGIFGKWDLAGHSQTGFNYDLLPGKQGFDVSFNTPGSNDAYVNLVRDRVMIEARADMAQLTRRYTDEAISFIKTNADRPFFAYVPHTMPHTILAVSEEFKGRSAGGFYGDVIEEIDHNVGRILDTVKAAGIDERTYIIYTSDNGPWWIRKDHGGHAEPLRGAKTSAWEGGLRVPCVIRAPGRVPAGVTCELVTATIDILPTIANIAGATAPTDRVIDGIDIGDIWHGKQSTLDRAFFYYQHNSLRAVRRGPWKLHLPHSPADRQSIVARWLPHIAPEDRAFLDVPHLYNLDDDIGEARNVAVQHPEIVARLRAELDAIAVDLGNAEGRGSNARPWGNEPYQSVNTHAIAIPKKPKRK
jgi:arylsulfatase A-like enzyme